MHTTKSSIFKKYSPISIAKKCLIAVRNMYNFLDTDIPWSTAGRVLFSSSQSTETGPPKNWLEKNYPLIIDVIFLTLIYIFLWHGLKMEWLLKDIIPIGGDVPYHYANYIDLKEILLPHFQLIGWNDASFAGFDIFQNYPIFPFILIYYLDFFMSSGVAFKIVMILGAVGLPLAIYWTLFITNVRRPGPIFGAILCLAYLFHNDHYAFGGNLQSVFSGEFSHSLSILFLTIYCGLLYKAFENKKYIPYTIVTLALIGFTHPITFAVAFFMPLWFLVSYGSTDTEEKIKGGFYIKGILALKIMLIGGLLFCTWAIGYLENRSLGGTGANGIVTSTYGWGLTFHYLIPKLLFPFALIFLGAILHALFANTISRIQSLFLWGFILSVGFFLLKFMGMSIRFLPLSYLFGLLFIASATGQIYQTAQRNSTRIILYFLIGVSALFIYHFVSSNSLFAAYRGTSGYNFMGAESQKDWSSVALTSEFLSEKFDTQTEKDASRVQPPRVFSVFQGDLLRVTSHASLFDALFSGSFFYTAGLGTGRQFKNKELSVQKFWGIMELSNVGAIVIPKEQETFFESTPYFSLIQSSDQYAIYQTNNITGKYVTPLKNQVYSISDLATWERESTAWYRNYSADSSFIVYNPDTGNKKNDVTFIPYDQKKAEPVPYTTPCDVQEVVRREKIDIKTDCIGRPLLVKYAYHQNWQVIGAERVYLATPAFMIIVPNQNHVTLYFGKKPYNYIAYICGVLGILLLLTHTVLERKLYTIGKKIYQNHKEKFHFISKIGEKIHMHIIGLFLLECGAPCILILSLLLSIAFIYTNHS